MNSLRTKVASFVLVALNGMAFSANAADLHVYEKGEAGENQMAEKLAEIFAGIATKTGQRGTHAKGICMDVDFEVLDIETSNKIPASIRERLQVGLFARPRTYAARLRFANAKSAIISDKEYDARAVSIAVDLGNERRQDFVLQNSPVFPIPSLQDFLLLMQVSANPDSLGGMSPELQKRVGYMFAKGKTFSSNVASYRTEKYWSGTAFALGEAEAVKYIAVPCVANAAPIGGDPSARSDDYLQEDLEKHLSDETERNCFDLHVQPLVAEKMTLEGTKLKVWQWVEDPTLVWNEKEAPSYPVARITFKKGSLYTAEKCDAPENGISVMKHTLPEHRGLGRINRGRRAAEEASLRARTHK